MLVGGGELQVLLNKHYCPRHQTNGKEEEEERKAGFSTASLSIDWGLFCFFVCFLLERCCSCGEGAEEV